MSIILQNYDGAAAASAGAAITTTAINTVGATLLVATVVNARTNGTMSASISDSASNTWTALTYRSNATDSGSQIFYVANPTTSATHTFTLAAVGGNAAVVCFLSFRGVPTASPFDQESGSGTATPGSITPSGDGYLLVAVSGMSTGTGPLIAATTVMPFVNGFASAISGGVHYAMGTSFMYQRVAAAINPVFGSGGTNPSSAMASFKAAATSSGGGAFAFAG